VSPTPQRPFKHVGCWHGALPTGQSLGVTHAPPPVPDELVDAVTPVLAMLPAVPPLPVAP
jgi:hypothetical protein